jgi:hypothetical protein
MSTEINPNAFNSTGFKFAIDNRYFKNVAFFVQSVEHPAITGTPTEVPASRFNHVRVGTIPEAPSSLTFSELIVTFILDEDWKSYEEIMNWMIYTVNQNYTPPIDATKDSTKMPTFSDISMVMLTNNNVGNKTFRYRDCIPTAISSIPLDSQRDDVTPTTFTVTFNYNYFDME